MVVERCTMVLLSSLSSRSFTDIFRKCLYPISSTIHDGEPSASAFEFAHTLLYSDLQDEPTDPFVFAAYLMILGNRLDQRLNSPTGHYSETVFPPDEVHDSLCELVTAKRAHLALKRCGFADEARDLKLLVQLATYPKDGDILNLSYNDPDGVRVRFLESKTDIIDDGITLSRTEALLAADRFSLVPALRELNVTELVARFVTECDECADKRYFHSIHSIGVGNILLSRAIKSYYILRRHFDISK